MKTCLIDTGPLVAYLDRHDPAHEAVAAAIERFTGQLVTTSAVIGEVMCFMSAFSNGPMSLARFLLASGIRIVESTQPPHILAAAELMDKYVDTPMDFADTTLVMLAAELGVTEIFTLDRRGFSTYRTAKGKGFRVAITTTGT